MNLRGPVWAAAGGMSLVIAITGYLYSYSEGMRTEAYRDVAGVWTICQGHTDGVQPGDKATLAECMQHANADLVNAYHYVDACIKVDVTFGQAVAFTDAAANLGPAVVCGSTLQKLANGGDMGAACDALNDWNKVTITGVKQFNQWQVHRRAHEYALCIAGLR